MGFQLPNIVCAIRPFAQATQSSRYLTKTFTLSHTLVLTLPAICLDQAVAVYVCVCVCVCVCMCVCMCVANHTVQ